MTQPTHTPAPWIAEIDEEKKYFQINSDMHAICTNSFCYEPFNRANARLIAAAPELLEALIEASNIFDNYPNLYTELQGTYEVITNAITKARG